MFGEHRGGTSKDGDRGWDDITIYLKLDIFTNDLVLGVNILPTSCGI